MAYNDLGFVPFCSNVKLKNMKSNNIQKTNSDVSVENGTKPMLAEVNYSSVDTWLEPYIGWKFNVIKKGKRSTSVRWWGRIEWIPNKRINFC